MANTSDFGKLVLRLGFGGLMISHGIPKLMMLVNGSGSEFANPLGIGGTATLVLAVVAEVICPVFIILGFKVRWNAILPVLTMLVAAFVVHGDDPWGKKEFALLYGLGFLAIGLLGSGKYAIKNTY